VPCWSPDGGFSASNVDACGGQVSRAAGLLGDGNNSVGIWEVRALLLHFDRLSLTGTENNILSRHNHGCIWAHSSTTIQNINLCKDHPNPLGSI
jgi:hypothetical protein